MAKFYTAVNYVRRHLIRFLLLAVILTAGLSLHMAAFAKYSSYLNDYTSVAAGDFFFTSDYLFAPEERTENTPDYTINSWKGGEYGITIELRNYENSLRFNRTGTDFFYWVEVEAYQDESLNTLDSRFRGTVSYTSVGATDQNGKKYGFMPGMAEFDHNEGKQEVNVAIVPTAGPIATGTCYMKVTAHTVPLSEVSSLTMADGVSTDTTRGVYSSTQVAVFCLNITSTTANITTDFYPGSGSEYTVRYRVICNSSEGSGGSVTVKTYYMSNRLSPDISLGNNYADTSGDYAYSESNPWRYVMTRINVGGAEDLLFYKKSLSLNPPLSQDDLGAVVLNTEDIDTTPYSISAAASISGGSISGIKNASDTTITEASMGTKVYVTLSPDSGYKVENLSVYDSASTPLIVTRINNTQYSFEMTNSNVVLTPIFVRRVIVEDSLNGTVYATPDGAAPGTTVYLTAVPDNGYELSSMLLNGSDSALTYMSPTQYSFVMPDEAVTVTAVFTETTDNPSLQEQ